MENIKLIDINKFYTDKDDVFRVLDVDGNLINGEFETTLSHERIIEGYTFMVKSRQQDTYMTQLQRQGRMLTFAPNFGEEALQVATSLSMQKSDWFVPAFRSNATMLHLGVPLKSQLLYWNGNERGSKMPEGVNVLPINIPIGTQFSHAIGLAYGMKLTGDKSVAITIVGNGGTAEGETFEAMNIASIHKYPVVFTINNNQWSISTPDHLESGSLTHAIKGVASGVPAIRVDGNDLLASHEAMRQAVEHAREGKGPVLVEFITWREGPHTTSDNPRVYRTEQSEKDAEQWEPMHRIEKYMMDRDIMSQEQIDALWASQLEEVKASYEESIKELDTTIDEAFDHTYATLTDELKDQKADSLKRVALKGDA